MRLPNKLFSKRPKSVWVPVVVVLISVALLSGVLLMGNQGLADNVQRDKEESSFSSATESQKEVDAFLPGTESELAEISTNEESGNDQNDTEDIPRESVDSVDQSPIPQNHKIQVPYLTQQGQYPSGCEIVSATMLLRYYGYSITVEEFIDDYLDIVAFNRKDGVLYGPDPKLAFAGDPRDSFSCGCYAPVIENSLNRIVSNEHQVDNVTGTSLQELSKTYIAQDIPVIIWASIDMKPLKPGNQWITVETGEPFQWLTPEHCLVLVGYTEGEYIFNDPYENKGVVSYDKELVETRFQEMGEQAVVILES